MKILENLNLWIAIIKRKEKTSVILVSTNDAYVSGLSPVSSQAQYGISFNFFERLTSYAWTIQPKLANLAAETVRPT